MLLDWNFIWVCGEKVERGATIIEPNEVATFCCIVRQAAQVVVVQDSSKITLVSPALICPVTGIDILITDSRVRAYVLAGFQAKGVQAMSA